MAENNETIHTVTDPLPCPFCGEVPTAYRDEERPQEVIVACINGTCDVGPDVVAASQVIAVLAWNTRAKPSPLSDAEKFGGLTREEVKAAWLTAATKGCPECGSGFPGYTVTDDGHGGQQQVQCQTCFEQAWAERAEVLTRELREDK